MWNWILQVAPPQIPFIWTSELLICYELECINSNKYVVSLVLKPNGSSLLGPDIQNAAFASIHRNIQTDERIG